MKPCEYVARCVHDYQISRSTTFYVELHFPSSNDFGINSQKLVNFVMYFVYFKYHLENDTLL